MFSKRTCFACNSLQCIAALPDMSLFVCEVCMVAKGLQPLAWADIDNKLAAPWTVEQVASLNGGADLLSKRESFRCCQTLRKWGDRCIL